MRAVFPDREGISCGVQSRRKDDGNEELSVLNIKNSKYLCTKNINIYLRYTNPRQLSVRHL